MNVCTKCNHPHDESGKWCGKCKKYYREWNASHREKRNAWGRKYGQTKERKESNRKGQGANRKKYSERRYWRHIEDAYGINQAIYKAILVSQDSVCAICCKEDQLGKRLSVDHDHETGAIRGLLCTRCNTIIGKAKESPELLRAIADYIENFDTVQSAVKESTSVSESNQV